ncbi:PQQ-binding-like beta-propeller repeat protein, partial [Streptomyces sp. ISL-36]|uniref:outer membrane protein assembly factor BamB family protein n=1 Tax=Streptomyces sp. ISL-36 TaxID=2819182 RepID=UPI001BEAC2CC
LVERSGILHGHDLRTGKGVWELPDANGAPPVRVPGDRVLVLTFHGLVLCSLRDGRTEWLHRTPLQGPDLVQSVLAVEATTAWLLMGESSGTTSGGYHVAAFDLDRRRELWRTPLPKGFGSDLSVTLGPTALIVEALPEGEGRRPDIEAVRTLTIAGFDRRTGAVLWNRSYPEVYGASSSVVDAAGRVYFLSLGRVYAYDLMTGRRLWDSLTDMGGEHGPPLLTHGALCLSAGTTRQLLALAPDTGRRLWEQMVDEDVEWFMLGRMAVSSSGRTLFLPTIRQIAALDITSGRRLWQTGIVELDSHDPFQLAVAPGMLLIAQPSAIVAVAAD